MRKISLILIILVLVTVVMTLASCAKQEEAVELAAQTSTTEATKEKTPSDDFPHDENGNLIPPLLPAILAELVAGNVDVAFSIIMDAFSASAGLVGAVAAVVAFLLLLAVYYLGLWILI